MIREFLESGYQKTIGSLWRASGRLLSPVKSRGGLLQLFYILAVTGLMGGFISAVDFPVPNQGAVIYPGAGAQTIPEAVINGFVILLGAAGIYLTFISGRQTTKPRMVNFYLILALLLIATGMYLGFYVFNAKG